MADVEEQPAGWEQIRAQIAAARQKKSEAGFDARDAPERRKREARHAKTRVNASLLRGQGPARDETWTIRARADYIRAVKALAERLSEPRAKVSVAALMEEAVGLLLQKYRERDHGLET
jgi:hypothetical protein